MAFGNPYGDLWNSDIVMQWTQKIIRMGIKTIALSDTIGVSNADNISYLFKNIIPEFPQAEIGAHLHTTPNTWFEKVEAAYYSGCRRFDGAINGLGGCPMAADKLTGNMPTENLLLYFKNKKGTVRIRVDEDGDLRPDQRADIEIFGSNPAVDKMLYTVEDKKDEVSVSVKQLNTSSGKIEGELNARYWDNATDSRKLSANISFSLTLQLPE